MSKIEMEGQPNNSNTMQDIMTDLSVRSPETEGHISSIRKMSHEIDDEWNISHSFWYADGWADYTRYPLSQGIQYDIKLGEKVCIQCQQKENLDHDKCSECIDPDSPFRTRLSCMFNDPSSPLVQNGECTKDDLACNYPKNKRYCHSKHVVYIGRIGNLIKIGITRKRRRGTYLRRFVEQGLNEVISIIDFPSLPKALETEQWFEDMGYDTAITFLDKIDQLRDTTDPLSLPDVWSEGMLKDRFEEQEIEHKIIYPDRSDLPKIKPGDPTHFYGDIFYLQGPIIITFADGVCRYWDSRDLLHREVLSFDTDAGVGRWD